MFLSIIGMVVGLYVIVAVMSVLAALVGVVGVVGVIIGAVFSGASLIFAEAFSGEAIVIGIVMGLVLYFWLRNRNQAKEG